MNSKEIIKVSAPGRIVLVGEHQDYFGLKVISAAINKRIFITGTPRHDKKVVFHLKDLRQKREILLSETLEPENSRDYLISSLETMSKKGFSLKKGYDISIESTIPIGKGVSSSSALTVAWCGFIATSAGHFPEPEALSEYAYESEVLFFKEPGGMQDHYASACGGLIAIDCASQRRVCYLHPPQELVFLLGDSMSTKDTHGVLHTIRNAVSIALQKKFGYTNFAQLLLLNSEEIDKNSREDSILAGILATRDLVLQAKSLLKRGLPGSDYQLGEIINKQHWIISRELGISTEKIDHFVSIALDCGAHAAKINGSGGGGCFLVVTTKERVSSIEEKLTHAGAGIHRLTIDQGFIHHSP